ncbi:amino acid/amide ABC transporter substrate-binding protein (HAAT family) [Litorimonas taeanensis]|uniref:Amino acid/amide ABC transporter substrate-binding protein (HAAT family) n=1 Tax=Litorimonas taeanensis TaxID=568099 RepID=A0A420WD89_9PROT|nr:ABC transporter substrate-binding protein [Litorimonas taeanensis]RKQ69004.1 amino acid/amide ABC transporter substrate-binding protein (HAAT family) [Litorimonas taeanensis]
MRIFQILGLLLGLWIAHSDAASGQDVPALKIYHDSDWSNNYESSEAIWRGMTVALKEVGHEINGVKITLVKKNHSGNVTRSLGNMQDFLEDDQAIAVFAGMHSPPLIANRDFINENGIPVLVPWAAGGPITRYPSPKNSMFRLSLDDTKAGAALVDFATHDFNCNSPYILLESTSWGDSNEKSIKAALKRQGTIPAGIERMTWALKSYKARNIIQNVVDAKAECIILVANVAEGSQIALAITELDDNQRIPVISHWGITGGNFHEVINKDLRKIVDVSFLQTCFSFLDEPLPPIGQTVFSKVKQIYPNDISSPEDIKSPVGFVHAYDLMKILLSALETVELNQGDIQALRADLRESLEGIDTPVKGLMKTYERPFSVFSADNPDAHEALGAEHICLAKYGDRNQILVQSSAP